MLFDEHYSSGDPGPIASQQFYADRGARDRAVVPHEKLILMVGAYGYDWNDRNGKIARATRSTFQDVMRDARDSGAVMRLDRASLNPVLHVTRAATPPITRSGISTATTAYNQMRSANR